MSDKQEVISRTLSAIELLKMLGNKEKIEAINQIREALHEISPFKDEPVDFVRWVPANDVYANDYNPNSVAPPEMQLLEHSIVTDGYTQPIVTFSTDQGREVVDGFHRNRVGKESPVVKLRVMGYLPVVSIKATQTDLNNRIASTIRHNRARGKHKVDAMSDIVVELKRRNWSNDKIATELGMDQDEVLRLCQITGLTELFSDCEFSQAWDVEGSVTEADFEELDDQSIDGAGFRRVPSAKEGRIFHTYDQWECYRSGFYAASKEGMRKSECEEAYREFLSNPGRFEAALSAVISEWKHSCEHYLTNVSMNRIAWLGQASACYAMGIPAVYRGGFYLLTEAQQETANSLALRYLNQWLEAHDMEAVTMEQAYSTSQSELY